MEDIAARLVVTVLASVIAGGIAGGAGAYVGARVALAVLFERVNHLRRDVDDHHDRLRALEGMKS